MHVVHHANGASLADNLGKSGGVAVLAFLFEVIVLITILTEVSNI